MLRHLDQTEAHLMGQALNLAREVAWRAIVVVQDVEKMPQVLEYLENVLELATEKVRETRVHYLARRLPPYRGLCDVPV